MGCVLVTSLFGVVPRYSGAGGEQTQGVCSGLGLMPMTGLDIYG